MIYSGWLPSSKSPSSPQKSPGSTKVETNFAPIDGKIDALQPPFEQEAHVLFTNTGIEYDATPGKLL